MSSDSDLAARIARLTPDQRRAFEHLVQRAPEPVAAPKIIPLPRDGSAFPLAPAQQRLWFLAELEPDNPSYNVSINLELDGRLDQAALEAALSAIVDRHEVLRCVFSSAAEGPRMWIRPPKPLMPRRIDLSGLARSARRRELDRILGEWTRRPFDLRTGPLLRVALAQLGARRHALLMTLHHIICDGWSMGIFARELALLFRAFSAGEPPPLALPSLQFADFAHWHQSWLSGENLERQVEYWKSRLQGAPPLLCLPTDRPRATVRSGRGAVEDFGISAEVANRLRQLSRESETTLFNTLLAAWVAFLSRYTDQDDIVVGMPVAGRGQRETQEMLGFFVNTLALRVDLSGNLSFDQLLSRVRQETLAAYEHQDVPFERLVDALDLERNTGYMPLVQVVFSFENTFVESFEMPGLTWRPLTTETGAAKFDFVLLIGDSEPGQALAAAFEYNCDLFLRSTVRRMAGHFANFLAGVAAEPEKPFSALRLASFGELHQLAEWSCA